MFSAAVLTLMALEIGGASACPTATQVKGRVAPLLAPGFDAVTSDVVTLEQGADGGVAVLLDDRDGNPIAHRRFPAAPTCDEQLERVAVAVAAWEADLHPEIALRLDHLAPAKPPASPAPTAASSGAPVVQRSVRPAAAPFGAALGIAAFGDWQAGALAPGGRLDLTLGPASTHWRGRVGGAAVGTHTEAVSPGEARWWRIYGSLGADLVFRFGPRWAFAVGATGLAGVASIAGTKYDVNHATRSLDLGAELLTRVEWQGDRLRPWLGLSAAAWLRRQDLAIDGVSTLAALPRLAPALAVGADYSWAP